MYHFIINPASRSGQGAKYWGKVENYLNEHRIPYSAHISTHSGHVAELMRELTKDLTDSSDRLNVIVLGGDGTVNEALQGIMRFDKLILGYIPTGSSNDLARDLGISKDPIESLKRILDAPAIHSMDIGTIEYKDSLSASDAWLTRHFAVSCSIGYDAALTLNDSGQVIPIRRLLFLAGMNHRYEGGGFMFAPAASDHDGILDICCASNATALRVLRILPTAYKGNHLRFPEVDEHHITSYSVKTEAPMWLHADGEPLIRTDYIKVSCQKEILQFIS